MKINGKRTLAALVGAAILFTGAISLSACNKAQTQTDMTVALTSETTAPVVTPAPRPSAATGTMSFGGETVSATEFDFYYYTMLQQYNQYVSYGLVPTTADGAFDLTSACSVTGYEDKTWGDALLAFALTQVQDMHILESLAKKDGMTITDENVASIESFFSNLTSTASTSGMDLDTYLKTVYGQSASKETMEPVITRYFLASQYMQKIQSTFSFTDEELQAFYTENKSLYTDTNLPVVRHILFKATKGLEGTEDATEAELNTAKANAEAALAKVSSYEDMVAVGDAAVKDGSAAEAAEYTVEKDQMVAAFDTWCFDAARQVGDKAIVQTEYGYHVMYFVGSQKDWYKDAMDSLKKDKYTAYIRTQEALPEFAITVS